MTLRRLRLTTATPSAAAPLRSPGFHNLPQMAVAILVGGQKVHQPTFVDGDQVNVVQRPAAALAPRKGAKKACSTSSLACLAFVLAAVVVGEIGAPVERELCCRWRAVRRSRRRGECLLLQLLQECRLAVAGVARDDDQPELAASARQATDRRRAALGRRSAALMLSSPRVPALVRWLWL